MRFSALVFFAWFLLFLPQQAVAEIILLSDNRGATQNFAPAGSTVSLQSASITSTSISFSGLSFPGYIAQYNYLVDLPPGTVAGAGNTSVLSPEGTTWYLKNSPGGLPLGSVKQAPAPSNLQNLNAACFGAAVLGVACFLGAGALIPAAPILAPLCYSIEVAGISCFVVETGITLITNSPADVVVMTEAPEGIEGRFSLAFRVDAAAPGDWLTLGLNGNEFFRSPLSELTIGEVLYAEVPSALLGDNLLNTPMAWQFFIESTSEGSSQISFFDLKSILSPDEASEVPLPASMGILALGLAGMGLLRGRRIRDSCRI